MPDSLKRIVTILDYDGTVTTNAKAGLDPDIKKGLEPYVIQDSDHFFAIASFNPNHHEILNSLLPFLKKDSVECKVIHSEHYQQTELYFRDNPIPLIITTPHLKGYEEHVRALNNCKNTQIYAIKQRLKQLEVPISELHFYDDSEYNVEMAHEEFKQIYCHRVDAENPDFTIIEEKLPDPGQALRLVLKFYKTDRKSDMREHIGWYSYFGLGGFSRKAKLEAVSALIKTIDFGTGFDNVHLAALRDSRLGKAIALWEKLMGMKLEDYIAQRVVVLSGFEQAILDANDDYKSDDEGIVALDV